MKLGDAVLIEWVDSCGNGGWGANETITTEPMRIRTVGILFSTANKAVTVIQSTGGDSVDNNITIPNFAITRKKVIAKKVAW